MGSPIAILWQMGIAQNDRRRDAAMLAAVFGVALVVRLIFYAQLSDTPFGRVAFLDSRYYDTWAGRLADGAWLGGRTPFFVEPGYLYWLAAVKWLGGDIAGVRLVQAIVGAGSAALTAVLGLRLAGRRAGLVAGLMVALYAPLVHFEGLLLKTTLEVFLATLALSVAVAPRSRPLLLGAVSGAALVFKSNFVLMAPVLIAWAAWRERGDPRRAARAGAMVVLGMAPLLMATAARNHAVSGESMLLPWSSGINFYIGNGPEADGLDPTLPFAQAGPAGEGRAGKLEAERRLGRKLGYAESSQFWWDESWRHIQASPGQWLELLVQKTRLFLHHYEFTDNVSFYFVAERVPILRWLPFGYWLVVPLAFAGLMATCLRRSPERWLLGIYVVLQAAGVIAFHVIDRYRVAAVPCAIALGVAAIAGWRGAGRLERNLVVGATLLGIVAAVLLPAPIGVRGQNPAGQHRMLAMEADQYRLVMLRKMLGDEDGAQQAADAGFALVPERGRVELAAILLAELPEASAEVCLESYALGLAKIAALHCAAVALLALGEQARAEALLLQAIEAAPNTIDLWKALARVRWDAGDEEGAEQAFRRAAELMRGRSAASP